LQQLFGDNRAEWASTQFRDLFVEPVYHKKLESMRPCFLVGGRGTGKTTSLQSLHYIATQERLRHLGLSDGDQYYFGILVRMNKNRVRAFDGSAVSPDQWRRLFAHYFNLLVCLEICGLAGWLQERNGTLLNKSSLALVGRDLGLPPAETIAQLQANIRTGIADLQLHVNNPRKGADISISVAESPLRTFVQELNSAGLLGTAIVFCCVDEFENLTEYQQSVVNTYVKHAEPPLSYKIGVRKNGIRTRHTLDGYDLLKTPDDYAEIEIADEGFDYFARAVAELRLRQAKSVGVEVPEKLSDFLNELTLEEEANLLGAEKAALEVLQELSRAPQKVRDFFKKKSKAEIYFLRYWQETEDRSLLQLAGDWYRDEKTWSTRFGNYAYASLFALSRGNKGARIRKYYCGERVLLSLAAGNIRYFLELLEVAISYELNGSEVPSGMLCISAKSQTLAARDVGERRLGQLEGLADRGVQLKRLVLAIGKVFFELARAPNGRAPEVTSFVVAGNSQQSLEIASLLSEGVGHLAFEVDPRTKATTNSELKDDEYRLHRIFCAFFEISHRKKRRMTFDARDLLGVLHDKPSKAIAALLGDQQQSDEANLPEQLALFSAFYEDTDVT
jgi:hypothetical protein